MKFKPTTWYPIAFVLSAINMVGGGFALGQGEPMHAAIHGVLAVAFWLWARRLLGTRGRPQVTSGLESLELEMDRMRRELAEAQERLDFTERMLAQRPEPRRMGPEP